MEPSVAGSPALWHFRVGFFSKVGFGKLTGLVRNNTLRIKATCPYFVAACVLTFGKTKTPCPHCMLPKVTGHASVSEHVRQFLHDPALFLSRPHLLADHIFSVFGTFLKSQCDCRSLQPDSEQFKNTSRAGAWKGHGFWNHHEDQDLRSLVPVAALRLSAPCLPANQHCVLVLAWLLLRSSDFLPRDSSTFARAASVPSATFRRCAETNVMQPEPWTAPSISGSMLQTVSYGIVLWRSDSQDAVPTATRITSSAKFRCNGIILRWML